ncbi:MAG: hypothetical protein H7646_08550 [Candidatus Heimdallarchaeota archaeon]|nr:hypothetical protein [Candidatus Heimdallarchaeota archaeon]
MVCENLVNKELAIDLITDSNCIVCNSVLVKEEETAENNFEKTNLQKEISHYTNQIKIIRDEIKQVNSSVIKYEREIEESLLSLSFHKKESSPINQEEDEKNILSLSVFLDQLKSIDEEMKVFLLKEENTRNEIELLQQSERKSTENTITEIEKQFNNMCKDYLLDDWSICYKQFPKERRRYNFYGFEAQYKNIKKLKVSDSENAFLDFIFRITIFKVFSTEKKSNGIFLIETFDRYVDDKHLNLINKLFSLLISYSTVILTANRLESPFIQNLKILENTTIFPLTDYATEKLELN